MGDKTLHFICEKGKDHFAQPIINAINLNVVNRVGSNDLFHLLHTFGAKNIWVEWASHPAIMVSKVIRPWQKLIIRLHRYEMFRQKWMKKINWSNVDCVIFVNSELEEEFKNTVNNTVKTITIPNAIEIDNFGLNELSNINSILAYGLHFHPIKAYDKLIELFAKVTKQNPNFNLTIAGQKPTHEIYQKCYDKCNHLIDKFDLLDNVKLVELNIGEDELKTHSNIKTLLNSHNAIISYSDMESFHYAFAEGLLCGLQGFCRGWRELNPYEFWTDWCYDSEKSMIEGILDWGETTIGERQQIAKTNRKYILDNFSSNIIGKKYEKLFSEIAGYNL